MVRSFYRGWLVAFLLSALLIGAAAPGIAFAEQALKSEAEASFPRCQGGDVLAEMKANAPADFKALEAEAAGALNDGALFWRVTSPDGAVSHLMGTFHSTDPQITALDAPVKAAFESAGTVAVEVANLGPQAVQDYIKQNPAKFFAVDTPKLDQLLSTEDYKIIQDLSAGAGLQSGMVPLLKPWFANITFFAMPPCEVARISGGLHVLDNQIVTKAKAAGKKVIGLETLDDQYSAFANLKMSHQVTMLQDGIHNREKMVDYYMTSIRLYKERKLGFLLPLSEYMARDKAKTKAALDDFKVKLIDRRNEQMFENSVPLVKAGGAFIAVGALHLIGETGLVALFEKAGYKVEKVL